MSPPLLAATGLELWRDGHRLVGPVDLEVTAGETLAVVGPNGAGKTTLLHGLGGLLAPRRGRVELAGRDLAGLPARERARLVAWVPQNPPATPDLSVAAFVALSRYPHRPPWRGPGSLDRSRTSEALAEVGLSGTADRPLDTLSGGERQAAYLAAALAQESPLWLLDEPTAHLDPRHRAAVAALLARLRGGGRGLLLTTHDLELAAELADRVVALAGGEVLATGPVAEVFTPEVLERLFATSFEIERRDGRTRLWSLGSSG